MAGRYDPAPTDLGSIDQIGTIVTIILSLNQPYPSLRILGSENGFNAAGRMFGGEFYLGVLHSHRVILCGVSRRHHGGAQPPGS
jgi:hypothetical protein